MLSALIIFSVVIATIDLIGLFFLLAYIPTSLLVISQIFSGLAGLILLRRQDINLIYFIENHLQNRVPVIKEIWFELMVVVGCLFLCLPGLLTDLIGLSLLLGKTRLKLYYWLENLLNN
jgi:UPF0716 family protein affecting phage T7 exclusion